MGWGTRVGRGCGVLGQFEVETAILVAGVGLATRGGRHFILRCVEDASVIGDLNARVVAVPETELEGRQFRESVSERSGTDCTMIPISGPRTTQWECKFIRDQDAAPRSRRVRWKAEVGLNASDHKFCARVQHSAVVSAQRVSAFACMGLICLKMQMGEYRHRDRILRGPGK